MDHINPVGLNRNILECKDPRAGGGGGGAAVLIETYWNVKVCGCFVGQGHNAS